jgi:hypothetical protein
MKKILALIGLSALAVVAALPAVAKTETKTAAPGAKKEPAQPHWAHTYAAALEEAKERNCVLFATFHSEH